MLIEGHIWKQFGDCSAGSWLKNLGKGRMVGLAGLEPATFRPPDGRATRLRYSPTKAAY